MNQQQEEITVQIKVTEYDEDYYQYDSMPQGGKILIPKSVCAIVHQEGESQPKGWCIKRVINPEVLNKYMNSLDIELKYYQNWGYVVSDTTNFLGMVHFEIPEGFIEVSTVEDFFEKVGYNASPKLIAKSGEPKPEDFEISPNCKCTDWAYLNDNEGNAVGYYDSIAYEKALSDFYKLERKPIGVIDGKDVFEGDKVYHIEFKKLKIWHNEAYVGFPLEECEQYSKSYLSPKEANQRLKSEVEKVAETYPVTITSKAYRNSTLGIIDYAIELVEKEKGIIYLPE